ncbi:MAG: energy transducer TonB [Chitinophagaceae bacterium]
MEAGSILSADVLDIIFDERNKEYGAYDLRKNYDRRLFKAVSTTFLLASLVCLTYVLMASMKKTENTKLVLGPEVELKNIPEKPEKQLPPPPPPKVPEPNVRMLKDAIPLIVKDDQPTDPIPEQDDLDNAKIGTVNRDGVDDNNLAGPPVDPGKGLVEPPKKQDDTETIFTKVEIESQYPGGNSAWAAFLGRNLIYPQEAIDIDAQGTVYVQFIVDVDGTVSDVTAISGPEELRAAAVKVIKKSGKWDAAIQNGHKVKSYKKQPIVFKLVGEN